MSVYRHYNVISLHVYMHVGDIVCSYISGKTGIVLSIQGIGMDILYYSCTNFLFPSIDTACQLMKKKLK